MAEEISPKWERTYQALALQAVYQELVKRMGVLPDADELQGLLNEAISHALNVGVSGAMKSAGKVIISGPGLLGGKVIGKSLLLNSETFGGMDAPLRYPAVAETP